MGFDNKATFTISVDGERTGEKYKGEFACKILLSHSDQLARDARRRQLLGGSSPDAAFPRPASQADMFAELHVRVLQAPKWWDGSNGGLDLFDDAVLLEVHKQCLAAEAKHLTDLKKQAEDARTELKKADE